MAPANGKKMQIHIQFNYSHIFAWQHTWTLSMFNNQPNIIINNPRQLLHAFTGTDLL